ncbi:MAG TPA: dCMP deaminase family protein [Ktedonobacteraceae bacterium]
MTQPSWNLYYMTIAESVATRSSCIRRQVGAILVADHHIVSTGYNGTPSRTKNCNEGGCPRCSSTTPSLDGYERCLCVHAEQNTIALAARHGAVTNATTMYVTLRPCLSCLKIAIQAGIQQIVYKSTFDYEASESDYHRLLRESGMAMCQIGRE